MTEQRTEQYRTTLDIAGFKLALRSTSRDADQRIRTRYHDFITDNSAPQIDITLSVVPGAQFVEIKPGPWVIEVEYADNRLFYQSYLERGEVNLISGVGTLEMAPEASIENFLRTVVAWLCVSSDALMLHAAGVIRDGLGYVFFGPSGAGKTTTSRISAKVAEVVSDDLVIIRVENGIGKLYGVPFRGEMSEAPRANQSAPLKAIFRLRQDTAHFLEQTSSVTSIAELVAASPFVVQELSLSARLIEVCDKISRSVPILTLHFKRDDGFWKVIDEYFEDVS